MPDPSHTHALVEAALARRGEVVERLMEAAIPGYPRRRRYPDLEAAVGQAFDVIVARMRDGLRLEAEHLRPFVWDQVRKAALRGGSEVEILQSPLRAQRTLWEFLVELSSDSPEDQAALVRVAPVLHDYVEASSAVTNEAYLELHEALSSRSSIARYELIEGLLNGIKPAAGLPLSLARRCGLDRDSPLVVIVARRVGGPSDEGGLDFAVSALARFPGDHVESLAVRREDQIVVIRATATGHTKRLTGQLEEVCSRMGQNGTELAVATSAVHEGLVAVPEAYAEACQALDRIPDGGGVLALATLSAIDYLVVRAGNKTAWQLLPKAVRTFVLEDLADGGGLIDTLHAYIDADQNVKQAAEQLFIHPNTGHYRLDRISSRTGCNLRNFDDLAQIVVAIRLAAANGWSGSTGHRLTELPSIGSTTP